MDAENHFDAEYYRRFYGRGGVHDRRRIAHLASGVLGLCSWWGVRPKSVLDIGAGPGLWRDWFRNNHPSIRITSTDVSAYACTKYGHLQRDIATWRPRQPFDLVICHGVLQYIDDVGAERAISHIADATRHVLYLEVPTTQDFTTIVDSTATDMDVYRRSGEWYCERLSESFTRAGAGLWVRHGSVILYELEAGS